MHFIKKPVALACGIAMFAITGAARADQSAELQAQLDALKQQMAALQNQIATMAAKPPPPPAASSSSMPGISMKPGSDLTFTIGDKSEVTIYGHVDLSFDYQTSGLSRATGATGNNGWIADVSSNLSSFGIKGSRTLTDDLKGVFQFETEVMYAATAGTSDQAPDGTAQKGALGSRNSYVGLQSKTYGAIKLGKNDSPYKSSTARMDPFASSVADYNSIMGNTGGDARAEFDLRLPHAIWYESPNWSGVSFNVLVSPGQNRSTDGSQYALGEPDCTGGNSVGPPPNAANGCNDGSFKTAYSALIAYEKGPLYATAAYELHKSVNRHGDDLAPGSVGIADEKAYKLGVQYKFDFGTTVNAIYERMIRDAITSSLDERTRSGYYLALTQKITENDDLNFAYIRAGNTPGNPNGAPPNLAAVDGSGMHVNNKANQYSLGVKHRFDKRTTVYAVVTDLKNSEYAHYALGVSGHGIVTRNKDGDGNVFSGYDAKAVSVGMTYDF